MSEKINVRGVYVDNVELHKAAEICESFINSENHRGKSGNGFAVYTPNAEIIQACIEDASIRELINSADLVTPDGSGVVLASKILGTPLKAKTAGYDLGLEMARLSAENGWRVFLLGGKPETDGAAPIAEQAADKLREKFPALNVVGTHHGYFKKEGAESDMVIELVNKAAPDILYVCLGVPVQEKWIAANRDKMPSVRLFMALGGSLDGYSGNVKRAPKIFIKLGLEWFYRLICQPSRIGRMMKLPKFVFGTIFYKISGKYRRDTRGTDKKSGQEK